MLGNGHKLHGVVARLLYAGQDEGTELIVSTHLCLLLRHTDMCLIYKQILRRCPLKRGVLPLVALLGIPELCRIVLCLIVLHHARSVGGNAVVPTILAVDMEFVERFVRQQMTIHSLRQEDAPHAIGALVQAQLRALPRVEVAKDKYIVRLGQPLTEPPAVQRIIPLPAKITIAIGIVDNRSRLLLDSLHTAHISVMTVGHLLGDGVQPLVTLDHRQKSFRVFHNDNLVDTYTNIIKFSVYLPKLSDFVCNGVAG